MSWKKNVGGGTRLLTEDKPCGPKKDGSRKSEGVRILRMGEEKKKNQHRMVRRRFGREKNRVLKASTLLFDQEKRGGDLGGARGE